jgi:PIN domain nuclease of toxin-antitoxin system
MRGLMDTHTFLWWNDNDPKLSQTALQIIQDPTNTIYLSVVSVWEIIIKAQTGKMGLNLTPEAYVRTHIQANNFTILPVLLEHALDVHNLPLHHRDPFDRLLIAQSRCENMPILTLDPLMQQYAVQTLW